MNQTVGWAFPARRPNAATIVPATRKTMEKHVDITKFAGNRPAFVLDGFFYGKLHGWGVTIGRLGGLKNRFTVDGEGRGDGTANTLALKETYSLDDGHIASLPWTIIKRSERKYQGREALIAGTADGGRTANLFIGHMHERFPPRKVPAQGSTSMTGSGYPSRPRLTDDAP